MHEADLTGDSKRVESAIHNIFGTVIKGEPLQILHLSGFSGMQEWRQFAKRYSLSAPRRGLQFLFATIKTRQTPLVDMNVFHRQVGNNSGCIVQGHLSNTPSQNFSKQQKKDRTRLMDFEFSELGEVNRARCWISGSFSGVLPRLQSKPCFVRAPNSVGQARTCGTRAASFGRGPPSKFSTSERV